MKHKENAMNLQDIQRHTNFIDNCKEPKTIYDSISEPSCVEVHDVACLNKIDILSIRLLECNHHCLIIYSFNCLALINMQFMEIHLFSSFNAVLVQIHSNPCLFTSSYQIKTAPCQIHLPRQLKHDKNDFKVSHF